MPGTRVLVVDDHPANLKLVGFLLGNNGFEVTTASNADEALRCLAAQLPELVLMDVQLPGMDGLTLTRQLRARPETQALVIVAFTAYAMRGDEARAMDAGCDAYITKPFDTRTLPQQLKAIVAARRPA